MAKLNKKTTSKSTASGRRGSSKATEDSNRRSSSKSASSSRESKATSKSSRSSSSKAEGRRTRSSSGRSSRGSRGKQTASSSQLPIILGGVALAAIVAGLAFFLTSGGEKPKKETPISPVVVKDQPKKGKKSVPVALQKKIYQEIAAEHSELLVQWKEEAEKKYPRPEGEDTFTGRERRRKVNAYETSMEKNYRVKIANQHEGVSSRNISDLLHKGFMESWAK